MRCGHGLRPLGLHRRARRDAWGDHQKIDTPKNREVTFSRGKVSTLTQETKHYPPREVDDETVAHVASFDDVEDLVEFLRGFYIDGSPNGSQVAAGGHKPGIY